MADGWSRHRLGRRWVLVQAVRGVVGVAVLSSAACSVDTGTPSAKASPKQGWARVDLGPVAAYVLSRNGSAVVVDTGLAGRADSIATVLGELGTDWEHVREVVLTHKHPDHAGSLGDVLDLATKATGYVGAADLSAVRSPRPLVALRDGDDVGTLQVVATPGHTAGHVALFDRTASVLVAGDALTNRSGLTGSSPQFTEDAVAAKRSVAKLALLEPRTIFVGHGPPVTSGAAAALTNLAASLR